MIYKIIILLIETFAIIGVFILAALNSTDSEKYIRYLILFSILSILFVWVNPILTKLSDNKLKNALRPKISIEFHENGTHQLSVNIFSEKPKGSQIRDLDFKFDVPGEFIDYKEKIKDKVGNVSVSHYPLAKVGTQGTAIRTIIATTVYIHCSSLMPNGNLALTIDFKPTGDLPIPGRDLLKNSNYPTHYTPLMDLHDYSPITYSWTFNGNTIVEKDSVNLEDLNYIKKDNEELVKQVKWYPDLESVKEMELKRKNW